GGLFALLVEDVDVARAGGGDVLVALALAVGRWNVLDVQLAGDQDVAVAVDLHLGQALQDGEVLDGVVEEVPAARDELLRVGGQPHVLAGGGGVDGLDLDALVGRAADLRRPAAVGRAVFAAQAHLEVLADELVVGAAGLGAQHAHVLRRGGRRAG